MYGLVLFLDAEPYCQSQWYRRLISQPYHQGHATPNVDLFSSLMWRNSKDDVAHELQLPEQTEQTHWLTFSLVEKYFYRKQREMCQTEASKVCMYITCSLRLFSA
ncbi:E3 ubiquitin-protein ligase SHPRH [Geodia barretti]|uniref:E3 ubiquitin-protein ligase SHPRH n=1 Tax=Geodia barretti TaxID=519541 RepID=A0AA35X3F0_GEOBA|nr:E3 ubiquitin-protein ligase SHPRH [Geodia barretti]